MARTLLRAIITVAVVITLITPNGSTTTTTAVHAATFQTHISGPSGSGQFGYSVTTLPNGNFVVTDPYYDAPGPIVDVGAVYLYNGATHALISTLTGSTTFDQVGGGGIQVLTNGNYVVVSPNWENGIWADLGAVTWASGTIGVSGVVSAANSLVGSTTGDQTLSIGSSSYDVGYEVTVLPNGNYVVASPGWDGLVGDAGAVTWGNGTTGVKGVISAANSLVGSNVGDQVGFGHGFYGVGHSVVALTNGNYVVTSPYWDNGAAVDVGAVTWGNGATGVRGMVSAANSLVGSTTNDRVGYNYNGYGLVALTNGNYVVANPNWDNGAAVDVGAVTWGNGTTGVNGVVSAANSLVGSTADDQVGFYNTTALTNGNYVVASRYWDNGAAVDAGAVTWGNGTTGVTGIISAANSLVGATAGDLVGDDGITALANGNYVVANPNWDNGAVANVGAVTWGNGTTGVTGIVSAANSLVGSTTGDLFGNQLWDFNHVRALANGNYVVVSPNWDGAAVDVGAVTWGNGMTGVSGVISAANSLVGSAAYDYVGSIYSLIPVSHGYFIYLKSSITALTNGNYVVASSKWDDGMVADAGAITWGSGTTGVKGVVSATNSLVGLTAGDQVGYGSATALTNGNYVVASWYWDNGAAVDVGAVTWGNGMTGVSGVISAANSLVGSTAGDMVDFGYVTALTNGDYVVGSSRWDNGMVADVGAVTWDSGTTGRSGVISAANSLVGSTAGDQVGAFGVTALANGNYVVQSPLWDNGTKVDAGAITLGKNDGAPLVGPVTAANSILGTAGHSMNFAYDDVNDQLVVGRPADNIVTLFSITSAQLDTTGVFRPSNGLLYLKNSNTTGFADVAINYGIPGDYPVVGDWDGNGTATIGIYRNGSFYLRNSNTVGFADWVFAFGIPGDQPIAGDWDGDGVDTVGVFRTSTGQFLLRDSNSVGPADYSFYLGNVGDVGIAGDWTAKGFDTVGVFRPSNGIIFLKNTNQTGFADIALNYGNPGDLPVVGDWDGNGTDTIGVYRNAQFLLRNSNDVGFADIAFYLGNPGDMPIAGDWDGLP